jgi:hypothetical protein
LDVRALGEPALLGASIASALDDRYRELRRDTFPAHRDLPAARRVEREAGAPFLAGSLEVAAVVRLGIPRQFTRPGRPAAPRLSLSVR